MSSAMAGLALPSQPSTLRHRPSGFNSTTAIEPSFIGQRRNRPGTHSSLICRGREQPDGPAFSSSPGRGPSSSSDAFQKLQLAVLSSLDYADVSLEALSPSSSCDVTWEEPSGGLESMDEASHSNNHNGSLSSNGYANNQSINQGKAAYEGKSVYETLRIDKAGKARRVYVRRRDLIRGYGLQLRDLRRVDPSLSPTKTSPSVAIKEECVLINIGGVRAIITADKCLLFEPTSTSSRKFVELATPRLRSSAAERSTQPGSGRKSLSDDNDYNSSGETGFYGAPPSIFPFELEILEAAMMVATGRLEEELVAVTRRVGAVLSKLPREITPRNLEELRRVKQLLVELESKAENLRDTLDELMDDEDEIIQLNLSSRPKREEKRRQREIDRLERERDREWADRGMRIVDGLPASDPGLAAEAGLGALGAGAAGGAANMSISGSSSGSSHSGGSSLGSASVKRNISVAGVGRSIDGDGVASPLPAKKKISSRQRDLARDDGRDGDRYQDAQDAIEERLEEEEEEKDLEEVEDLLEYYLQRAATTQSEAERLLAGARDLEESIGVSLSARRFEVNRLELLLSMASFAAALGAMVASIFGMNLRSTFEESIIGFWGTTALIVAGCMWVFWVLYKYTKAKRIL